MKNNLCKILENEMYDAWYDFVDEIRANNKRSNERIFKLLDKDFVKDYKNLMSKIDQKHTLINIVKNPIGTEFEDKRFKTIPKIWVHVNTNSSGGSLCVKITDEKYLKINY